MTKNGQTIEEYSQSLKIAFSEEVERTAQTTGGSLGYMEIVLDLCQEMGIEEQAGGSLLTESIKEKIRLEAEAKNMMAKIDRL